MRTQTRLHALAPAKLNLALHVQGKRSDGYHLLETLIVFTDFGDKLSFVESDTLSLEVTGPFAAQAGNGGNNLVIRAAKALIEWLGVEKGAVICLEKYIPVGAGLGGGSSDAAVTLKMLRSLWGVAVPDTQLMAIAAQLGADVPACLLQEPHIATGIGEELHILERPLPALYVVMVHPNIVLNTKDVFSALTPDSYIGTSIAHTLQRGLFPAIKHCKNSLQRAAITQCSEIANILLALETSMFQPDLVRMTGSGACCFALFQEKEQAQALSIELSNKYPQWWVQYAEISK